MEVEMLIAADGTPPLSLLATAKVVEISVTVIPILSSGHPPVIILNDSLKVEGTNAILHYFASKGAVGNMYYRDDTSESKEIYKWLRESHSLFSGSDYEKACKQVDEYLVEHVYLVGRSISVADMLVWSYLAGAGKRWVRLMESKEYPNLAQWYNMISTQHGAVLDEVLVTYLATNTEVDLLDAEMGNLDEDKGVVDMLKTDAKESATDKRNLEQLDMNHPEKRPRV